MVSLSKFKSKKNGPNRNSTYLNVTSSGSNIGGAHIGSALDTAGNMTVGRGTSMMSNGSNRIMNQGALDGTFHRSAQARGISQLEYGRGVTHWIQGTCPYSSSKCPPPNSSTSAVALQSQFSLEAVDLGACYYRRHFYGQDHENWFGSDEILGPLAISIKREKTESGDGVILSHNNKDNGTKWMYRLIVRSTELNTLRGAILEESIPGIKTNSSKGGCHAKEVIEFLLPEIQLSCLKLGLQTHGTEDQLLKLDQQILTHRHKVGIMYCKAGQATEEEMYNNEEAGPAFNEFLDLIGDKIRLKGFDRYTGGLDTKDDSTGLYSVHSQYQDCDVIFHVSTLLPFTANNRQQLMRKRHIGNDIVTIVFQEPGALPFTPKNIRSQFQHVFVVVRVLNPCTENTCYSVSVSRSKEVPLFGPPIPEGGKFSKNKEFVNFLLAKVINAENATYRSEKFTTMATRTRQEYLKDLVNSYSSNTSIDPRPKFSMLPFGNKKKEMGKPVFNPDPALRGALSWAIYLDDNSSDARLDAYLGISVDSLVIIDSISREAVFAIPTSSILGWKISMCNSNSLRIYYHQGECVTLHNKELGNWGENDDLLEIVKRLEAVTRGCETEEYSLRRNDLGQLGFHVQQDGVVTEVESCGFAAKAGLKQGSRLVEICKVAVATLSQDEMIDHLKTSNPVIIMVVPPLPDGSPRRGCDAKHCIYMLDLESEYENLNLNETTDDEPPSLIHHQFKSNGANSGNSTTPASGNHRKRYEPRSFSPPRSSNSSGYGTGSSSKSFSSASDPQFPATSHEGETLTSSSSGMSSTDDRWYDLNEQLDNTNGVNNGQNSSPPPIPARNANNANRVLLAQQQHQASSLSASPLSRPVPPTITAPPINNDPLSSVGLNNVVPKGNARGTGASPPDLLSNTSTSPQSFQNETSVVVVNNLTGNKNSGVNGSNGVVNASRKDNNSSGGPNNSPGKGNNINGGNASTYQSSSPGGGIYMTPKLSACIAPVSGGDKVFGNKIDYFQRNNPHHGSFHMKLSPSRSHDLLHLKSTYGMNHGLKPFTNGGGALDDYGVVNGGGGGGVAVAGRILGNRLRNGNDAQVLYQHVNGNGGRPAYYNSPLIENTVKGKVTYLTDFPLTHSQSSEYLVGSNVGLSYSNYESPMQKDINALKNERLAMLKSTYLEKQREKHLERVDNNNEVNKMQYSNNKADSISGEIGSSQDELCLPKPKGTATPSGRSSINSSPKVSSQNGDVKMRPHGSNSSTPRSSANRNSTLQEDLIRLIAPELISASEEQDTYGTNHAVGKTTPGVRPSSSNSATANLTSLKSRPMSCGSEPGQASSNYMITGKVSPARAPLLTSAKKSLDRAQGANPHAESLYGVKRRLEQQLNDEQPPTVPATVPIPLLPDSEHLDWSTLVDTATKAFQCCDIDVGGEGSSTGVSSALASVINTPPLKLKQSTNSPLHHQNSVLPSNSGLGLNSASMSHNNSLSRGSGSNISSNCSTSSLLPWIDDVRQEDGFDDKTSSSTPSAEPVFQFNLEARVSHLEAELRKEQHSRQQLAATVANLQHENRILRLRSTDQSPLPGSNTNKVKMELK